MNMRTWAHMFTLTRPYIHVLAENRELIYCTRTSDYCSPALQLQRLHLDSMSRNLSTATVR